MSLQTVFLIVFTICVKIYAQELQGPVFVMEPPANLVFSNMTGSQVSCSAHGAPAPQVDWLLQDGSDVTAVPGLRQTLGNGTLYFPPFRAQDYRKDIHHTVYRCRAANQAGAILSRDVAVQAIVKQNYEIQVFRTHVVLGNTAVLACVIPEFVRSYVTISSWFKDDNILFPGRSDAGGRFLVTSGTGNLHIRAVREEDGNSQYSCLTIHSLTHERKRSPPVLLTISAATGSMPPRLTARTQNKISMEQGSDVHLSCAAQGYPIPTFTWYREIRGHLEPVLSTIRINPSNDVLYIRRVELDDAGTYVCHVINQFGEQRIEMQLTVTAHLEVHVLPSLQIVNSGETATFNCSVLGSPIGSVQWLRNGELIDKHDNHIKMLSPLILQVVAVTRHDRGMYQCVVRNDWESAQGSAELRLGDTIPELQYTFIEQSLTPGPHVSLRCSATGSPPPQFRWYIDGQPVSDSSVDHRYSIGQFVDQSGDVVSHLNITNIRTEDGGLYKCKAINTLGSASHQARLNIYGPPSIRVIGPIKAVAGTDIVLQCPFSGYPISSVKWERYGHELSINLQHRITETDTLGALVIKNVDPNDDSGIYKCLVMSRNGELVQREIQLIVNSPPVLEPFSFPTNLQEGARAQVSCSVTSGDMPIAFHWLKDNMPLPGSLNIEERTEEFFSILVFKEVSAKHSGAYTCIARNSAAQVNYTATLMVKVAPQWVIEPHDVTTLLGNPVEIHCDARGYPIPKIVWFRAEGKMPNDFQTVLESNSRIHVFQNGSIIIDTILAEDEGYYMCRAYNEIGSGLNKIIYLGVNEPARFEIATRNISTKRGEQAVLICEVLGDTPIQISWQHNNNRLDTKNFRFRETEQNINNGVRSKLVINHTDRQDSGVYKCQAANMFGRSEMMIYLAVQERPDPPTDLEIVEVGSRFVRLAWKRGFDGNSPLLGYLVQYQVVPSGIDYKDVWEQLSSSKNIYNLTLGITPGTNSDNNEETKETTLVGGLHPATTYSLRMLTINSIDQSLFTEPSVVKTQEEAPVEAPQNVQVETGGPGELFLTWQIPPKNSWNGELLGYIITWNEQGAPQNVSKTLTVRGWGTVKAQLTGLKKFSRYTIIIRAFNSVASGPPSVPVVGVTLEGVPEASPQNVACSQISSQSMKISWIPPPTTHHGGLLRGYKVFYRPVPTIYNIDVPTIGEVKRTPSTETYLHTLYKYTNYSIRVLAFTGAGDGPLSVPIFCRTDEDIPGPPAGIKAAALSGDSILISWLPPTKPNGRIIHYTVFRKDANISGKNTTLSVRIEGNFHDQQHALMYKMRGLVEHQLYEFWVTATTGTGEGGGSKIVSQSTNPRAPARILSFSQTIHRAMKSKVLLKCVAAGNPTARTRWLHRDKPITYSTFYEITSEGHLDIHSVDESLAGNYTCSANNLFGSDEITYTLVVLLTPGAPILELEYSSLYSIRLNWKAPEDGGSGIQGYILHWKKDTDEWQEIDLSPEMSSYTLDDLKCGTIYHMYLTAHNRVGNGNPSAVLSIKTKGDKPGVPKEIDLISTNATVVQVNLFAWPDSGCPISYFTVDYRPFYANDWILVSNFIVGEIFTIQNLTPASWYQLRITVHNDAGTVSEIFNFATTTWTGEQILPPVLTEQTDEHDNKNTSYKLYIILSTGIVGSLLTLILIWQFIFKAKCSQREQNSEIETSAENDQPREKTVERDNRRNCQQIYLSSTPKPREKVLIDEGSEMYEISPYATFSVSGDGERMQQSRSVTTSTLDYTVQFKTFGHLENEDLNAKGYPIKGSGKHSLGKHRYYNTGNNASNISAGTSGNSGLSTRSRNERVTRPCDSESDDTSDSPCNYCTVSSAPTYRMPVKPNRGEAFRTTSSTESNDISPVSERWQHTPRHLAIANIKYKDKEMGKRDRRQRPSSSSSSSKDEEIREELSTMAANMHKSQPLTAFSDSREFSETECDRLNKDESNCNNKMRITDSELANLITRYQEQKLEEQKEFTIHV